MGFFGRLFGKGPTRPPRWASGFGDGDAFARFVEAVIELLAGDGHGVSPGEVASGSVLLAGKGGAREWLLHEAAARCAASPETAWRAILAEEYRGEAPGPPRPPRPTAGKAWVIGTSAWGGVMLECGAAEVVLLLLPIADASAYGEMPVLPASLVKAMFAFNARDAGVLAIGEVARRAGQRTVYALDPAKPADGVSLVAIPARVRVGPLTLERRGGAVLATWNDGTTALVGDAITFAEITAAPAHNVVGGLVAGLGVPDGFIDALMVMRRVVLMANLPGVDAALDAEMMAHLGVDAEIAHQAPPSEKLQAMATELIDAGRHADAEPLLRRAVALDRDKPELVAELGYCLSQLGRDHDAIAAYDESIGRGGAGVLLRFNRGNCRIRLHLFADAVADFRACVALKADWHEARVNLVSALFGSNDRAAARAELEILRTTGGSPDHVAELEAMLRG